MGEPLITSHFSFLTSHTKDMSVPNQTADLQLNRVAAGNGSVLRGPILLFFVSGLFWLLIAVALWLLSAFQANDPFSPLVFPDVPWLTYGRVYPVAMDLLVYGWSSMIGVGAAIWILNSMAENPLQGGYLPLLAGIIWNLGLVFGVWGVLGGGSTGNEWLEFPLYAAFPIWLGEIIMAIWAVALFIGRRGRGGYISQAFLLTAFIAFAWAYGSANGFLQFFKVGGPAQPAIQWWYFGCLISLWLTPLCVGIVYHFVPLLIGRPLYSAKLAAMSFWGIVAFGGWTGIAQILGSPLPAWNQTASVVANVLLVVPVLAFATNLHLTMKGSFDLIKPNLALRFLVTGGMVFGLASIWNAITTFRSVNHILQFTWAITARTDLFLIGFVMLVCFGAIYYILPRLVGRSWKYTRLIQLHFWFSIIALGTLAFNLTIAGVLQGFGLMDQKVPFAAVIDLIKPFLLGYGLAAVFIGVAALLGVGAFLSVFVNPAWAPDSEEAPEPVINEEVSLA
jgi:cytochrome c oxidase cbb3-type subunit 1